MRNAIDHMQRRKMQDIRFTGKTTFFRRDLYFERTSALSSNFHQFCIPKSSCFMRETDFVFPGNFDVVCSL